ncbi:MAG TPA: hypothetical protein VHT73_14860 [Thermodesulfobacteriota bacterium]|nr:hypothetical protein [Thermodesulfobacteriota bacterium]
MDKVSSVNLDDFSLVIGGPFYRLLIRSHMIETESHHVYRRAILFVLITWLPLLILSALQGVAVGNTVKVPFLYDIAANTRFLIAGPILIIAEIIIDPRTKAIVKHFVNSGLIREEDRKDFESIVKEASKLLDLALVEATLLVIIVIFSISGFKLESLSGGISTWHELASGSVQKATLAGWWFAIVSRPFIQFLLLRWLFKLGIWYWCLWRVSRLNLRLIPTHPDTSGGLGFLGSGQTQFGIIAFAVSITFAAALGEKIIFGGERLLSYKITIVAYVVLQLILFLGPLFVFTPLLVKAKRRGLLDYGVLAARYTQSFDNKWVKGNIPEGESLLGSSDIQSLADLSNSFQIVRNMRSFPFSRDNIIFIVAASVIPMLPLLLTVIPLEEILLRVLKLLF